MHQMRMRVNEAGENDAAAEVEFARATGFAQAFDATARTNSRDASLANEERAIANDTEIAERSATPRSRSAKSEKLGAAGDEDVCLPGTGGGFRHGCQRY